MALRISVALCTYNGATYLPEQLASIAAQVRIPDEVVLCDDGSTDETIAVAERFAMTSVFPVQIHRNERNLGTAKNFEKAIALCGGDVIVTADQDDVWYPEKLGRVEAVLDGSPETGLVFSNADLVDGQGVPIGCRLWEAIRFRRPRRLTHGDPFACLLRRPVVTGAAMAFRARYRDLVLPIPASWVHDEWIALLVAAVARVIPIEEPLMQYRRHTANQIGVAGITVTERARSTLARPRDYFRERADIFEALRDRLLEAVPERPDLARRVAGKIAHYQVRAAMPPTRFGRVPAVLREFLSLRYNRYSGSSLASLRDLASRT